MRETIKKSINKLVFSNKILAVILMILSGILLSAVTYSNEVLPVGPLIYTSHTVDSSQSYPMHTLITNEINHLSFWLNQNDKDNQLLDVGAIARDEFTFDIGSISVNADGNKSKLHKDGFLFFNPNSG